MRYIDADALKEQIQFRLPIDNKNAEVISGCVDITRRIIDNAPTADVVEVVRCKDCKHFHRAILECVDGNPSDWGICDCEWFNSEDYDVTENDFCSYGERRNDG